MGNYDEPDVVYRGYMIPSAVVGTSKPGAAKAKLKQRAARRCALAGIATN